MDYEDDKVDAKIKHELDCLNCTSGKINQLENELCEKRSLYRTALSDCTQRLNQLSHKLGECINKARPYYEARRVAKKAHHETQQAALRFERAVSMHVAAREMVAVAEQGMAKDANREDAAWAEMLNHATSKVNDAEMERFNSESEHCVKAEAFKTAEEIVNRLEKKLRSSIKKSRTYFEIKQKTQLILEKISDDVKRIEEQIRKTKETYTMTLRNLEAISDAIHASRDAESVSEEQHKLLGERLAAVGAETSSFIESLPQLRVNSELVDGTPSNQTILNDLDKVDTTEHLSQLFESSTLDDTQSFNSDSSSSSSCSATSFKCKPPDSLVQSSDDPGDLKEESNSSNCLTTDCDPSFVPTPKPPSPSSQST